MECINIPGAYHKNTRRGDFAHKTNLTNNVLIEMPAHVQRHESEPSCIVLNVIMTRMNVVCMPTFAREKTWNV
jgi:hypothetical protein